MVTARVKEEKLEVHPCRNRGEKDEEDVPTEPGMKEGTSSMRGQTERGR